MNYTSIAMGKTTNEKENTTGKVCGEFDKIINFHIMHRAHMDSKA